MVVGSSIILPFLIPFVLGFFYLIFKDNNGDITLASLYGNSVGLILIISLFFAYGGPLVGGLIFYGENLSYCADNSFCDVYEQFFEVLVGIIWIIAWSYIFSEYLWPILKKVVKNAFARLEEPHTSQRKNTDHLKKNSNKPRWSEPGFSASTFKAASSSENNKTLNYSNVERPWVDISETLNEKSNIQLKSELRKLKADWKRVSKEIDKKGGPSVQTNELLGIRNSLWDNILKLEKILADRNKEKRWF